MLTHLNHNHYLKRIWKSVDTVKKLCIIRQT